MTKPLGPVLDVITWDYSQHPGPWCINHKSSQCKHAITALQNRLDVPHLSDWLETAPKGTRFRLTVPMWPGYYMWEDLKFEVVHSQVIGRHGKLLDRGEHTTFDLGITQLLRGESAMDLGSTMGQMFADLMELDRPTELPGCKSGIHSMSYQRRLNELSKVAGLDNGASLELLPHLYGLLMPTPICAFCWADAYGGDARRVSDNAKAQAQVANFDDLLFEG